MLTENPYSKALVGKNEHLFHNAVHLVQTDGLKTFGYAKQISALLPQLGGNHVFHPPAEKIHTYIQQGHAQIITDVTSEEVFAFAKADPWVIPNSGVDPKQLKSQTVFDAIYTGLCSPVVIEIGSLFVVPKHRQKNWGKAMAIQMSIAAGEIYTGIPQIAVVTDDNIPSLAVFSKIGWRIINPQQAIDMFGLDVLEGWEPPSQIFLNPNSL